MGAEFPFAALAEGVSRESRRVERPSSVAEIYAPADWTNARIEAWLDWLEPRLIPADLRELNSDGDLLSAIAAWLEVDGRGSDRPGVEDAVTDLSPVLGVDAAFVDAVLASRRSLGDLTLR